MKSLILYYSYTGCGKRLAAKIKEESSNADVYEVKEKRRIGMFLTVLVKCPKAALRKTSSIQEISTNLQKYDKITLIAPIWNAYPAPEFNAILKKIPDGKEVELFLCSAGGETKKSKEGTCKLVEKCGCKLTGYHDVKASEI